MGAIENIVATWVAERKADLKFIQGRLPEGTDLTKAQNEAVYALPMARIVQVCTIRIICDCVYSFILRARWLHLRGVHRLELEYCIYEPSAVCAVPRSPLQMVLPNIAAVYQLTLLLRRNVKHTGFPFSMPDLCYGSSTGHQIPKSSKLHYCIAMFFIVYLNHELVHRISVRLSTSVAILR